jgi:hypothetical protein
MRTLNMAATALLLGLAVASASATEDVGQSALAPGFGPTLGDSVLEGLRGGTNTTNSDLQLTGTTASNTAYQMTTGNNAITSGSFSGLSGIPLVIQNTGANVLIQNALILNLQIN